MNWLAKSEEAEPRGIQSFMELEFDELSSCLLSFLKSIFITSFAFRRQALKCHYLQMLHLVFSKTGEHVDGEFRNAVFLI